MDDFDRINFDLIIDQRDKAWSKCERLQDELYEMEVRAKVAEKQLFFSQRECEELRKQLSVAVSEGTKLRVELREKSWYAERLQRALGTEHAAVVAERVADLIVDNSNRGE